MLSNGQQEITRSESRFKLCTAGRRFGKTYISMRELAKHARYPNKKIFYCAPSYRQAKQTVWQPLKMKLVELGWVKKVNESDLTITLINDSTISLRGADNFDSLRGVGLDFIVLDEFAYIKPEAWTEVLRPTLSDTNGSALFISTPAGKSNWAFDLFMRGQDPSENDWTSWQFTTADGGRVPQEEIEAARRDLDEKTFRQEYEASFETYSGLIYYGFDTKRNVKAYNEDLPKSLILMCDFNVNPMSAVVGVQKEGYIHIIDEIIIYGSNTNELVQEFRNRYGDVRTTAYPDPAGVQRKTSAGGKTDIMILQNAGFNVKFKKQHPAVKDRINAVNSALHPGSDIPKVLIDPKCKRLIESLTKHTYKDGTTIPDKESGFDHLTDAIGYGIEFIYPIKKDVNHIKQPVGWSVKTTQW